MAYTKVFQTMLDSSVWSYKSDLRIVWVTILLMKDIDGFVKATPDAIRRRANVSMQAVNEALSLFLSAEDGQEDQPHEGRRLEKVPGGYVVLNNEKYLLMDSHEQRKRRDRERKAKKRGENQMSADVPHVSENVQTSSAEFRHKIRSDRDKMRLDEMRGDEDEMRTPRAKRARRKLVPIGDWEPSLKHAAQADELGIDLQREAQTMRDWALSNDARKADWDATFRNWLTRKSQEPRRGPIQSAVRSTHRQLFPDMYEPKETP